MFSSAAKTPTKTSLLFSSLPLFLRPLHVCHQRGMDGATITLISSLACYVCPLCQAQRRTLQTGRKRRVDAHAQERDRKFSSVPCQMEISDSNHRTPAVRVSFTHISFVVRVAKKDVVQDWNNVVR